MHFCSQRGVHSVVNLGGLVKTLRSSNLLSRHVLVRLGPLGSDQAIRLFKSQSHHIARFGALRLGLLLFRASCCTHLVLLEPRLEMLVKLRHLQPAGHNCNNHQNRTPIPTTPKFTKRKFCAFPQEENFGYFGALFLKFPRRSDRKAGFRNTEGGGGGGGPNLAVMQQQTTDRHTDTSQTHTATCWQRRRESKKKIDR